MLFPGSRLHVLFVGLAGHPCASVHLGVPLCLRAPINICLVSLCPTLNRIFTPKTDRETDWEGEREREREVAVVCFFTDLH